MSTVLFVVTGSSSWTLSDGTAHPTGYWAEELVTPYRSLIEAGHRVLFATPGGVVPTVDARSLAPEATGGEDLATAINGIEGLKAPLALDQVDPSAYDAVFYPGGHGPMEDLAVDPTSGALIAATLEAGRPLGVVCHGAAALIAAAPVLAGRKVTAFSDAEEAQAGLAPKAPFLVESRLRELGAEVSVGEPWGDHVVVDGNLISGQNPQSSASVARALVEALA
ncbi:type 1 glutamine amidotransferase domain-containing protein [Nocardioides sp. GY 10113]|uniref:type 1 glutamine amidotransferase domain-containing protein n=1 Tax=Nocardioides sp. GY 10113 TaxID=2569761 RepID=UPI0010A80437|nr:type 1 glutamine amidotransferase domain-containing protein [Nocardioides sp. GY 10113]TIC87743.1 type 1 glutamine amidotransferase domain-containing protein [Nocardioides sp. GY 10113]